MIVNRILGGIVMVLTFGFILVSPALSASESSASTVVPAVTEVYSTQDIAADVADARADLTNVIAEQRATITAEVPEQYRTVAVDEAAQAAVAVLDNAATVSEKEKQILLSDGLNARYDDVEALLGAFVEQRSLVFAAVGTFNTVKSAEQARVDDEVAALAAQQAAEAEAAAKATEEALRVGVTQAVTNAATVIPHAFEYTVRPYASGMDQGLVDACSGPVWWTGNLLAEHWHCGGSSFPQNAGAIVNVAGVGTYRVIGLVGVVNGHTATTMDVPGGYDLIYQTCLNDNPGTTGFIALELIG